MRRPKNRKTERNNEGDAVRFKIKDINYHQKTKDLLSIIKKVIQSYDTVWTVRQIHYKLVALGVLPNTQNSYRKVSGILTKGRYTGDIPWNKMTDDTRTALKTTSWDNLRDALPNWMQNYRREGRWDGNDHRVEVWTEKRTLRRLLHPVTDKYDVYLQIGGGWNSTTAIWEAAVRMAKYNTDRVEIIYIGDLDPSGDDMPRDVIDRLRQFSNMRVTFQDGTLGNCPEEINISKLLVTDDQVGEYDLSKKFSVKAKKGGKVYDKIKADPRAKQFYDKYGELFQVEVEAMDPQIIVDLLENELQKHINPEKFEHIQQKEEEDQKYIDNVISHLPYSIDVDGGET